MHNTTTNIASSKKDKKAPAGAREVKDHVRFTEKTLSESLRLAARHHIESFDFAVQEVLPRICNNLLASEISAA